MDENSWRLAVIECLVAIEATRVRFPADALNSESIANSARVFPSSRRRSGVKRAAKKGAHILLSNGTQSICIKPVSGGFSCQWPLLLGRPCAGASLAGSPALFWFRHHHPPEHSESTYGSRQGFSSRMLHKFALQRETSQNTQTLAFC